MDATSKAKLRATGSAAARIAFLIVLGATLAGCDKCGKLSSRRDRLREKEACAPTLPQFELARRLG